MKKLILSALVGICLTSLAPAGEYYGGGGSKAPVYSKAPVPEYDPLCFQAGETYFDAISIYADPTKGGYDEGVGGGFAVGHWFTENIGVQCRAYWWDGDSAVHNFYLDAQYRFPIQDLCLAPYVQVGIGGNFDSDNQVSGNVGAGVEYRFAENMGIVAGYEWVYGDDAEWHLYTLGLRFTF